MARRLDGFGMPALGRGLWKIATRRYLLALAASAVLFVVAALGIVASVRSAGDSARLIGAHYQKIAIADELLSLVQDVETGQRGFVITGNAQFLEPYEAALPAIPGKLAKLRATRHESPRAADQLRHIEQLVAAKIAVSRRAVELRRLGSSMAAIDLISSGAGKHRMDRLRAEISRFHAIETEALERAKGEAAITQRNALLQALVAGGFILVAGALATFGLLRARTRLGEKATEVRQADQRFQATFDQAAVGMAHLDVEGRWLRVNERLCRITGYSSEDLTGTSKSITYCADVPRDRALRSQLVRGELDGYRTEKRYVRKDGSLVWVEVTASAVRDDGGEPQFFVAVVEDISARKAAEHDLRASEDRLRLLQREAAHLSRVNDMGEMAAAIAHEINQPLTAISNYLAAARLGNSDEESHELLSRAADQAVRAGEIVRRLRAFVGKSDGSKAEHKVGELIDAALGIAFVDAATRGISLDRRDEGDDCLVKVDGVQVQQVIVNLVRNAVEALDQGRVGADRRVLLSTGRGGDCAEILVSDNGPGIADDLRARLFEPFATSKPQGMGIGLSVSRRLIEAHGGSLDLVERGGPGATFLVRLPLAGTEAPETDGQERSMPARSATDA